jgi:Flp pilus assembly protein TadD
MARWAALLAAAALVGALPAAAVSAPAPAVADAVRMIAEGAYGGAVGVLSPQVRQAPRDLELRGLLALALYLNGQSVGAEWQWLTLRRADPSGRETAYLVSQHFLSAFRETTPSAVRLVSLLAGDGGDRFVWLAQTYQTYGRYADAMTILRRAAELFPSSVPVLDALGFNEWKAGMPASAIATYAKAIALQPRAWGLYFNLGWIYYTSGRYADAASNWKAALALNPSHPSLPALLHDAETRVAR